MPRGGPRPGSGRPKGAKGKLDSETAKEVRESGVMPVNFLINVMRDKNQSMDMRVEAAKAAAPYCHPRLSSIEHSGNLTVTHEDALTALDDGDPADQ